MTAERAVLKAERRRGSSVSNTMRASLGALLAAGFLVVSCSSGSGGESNGGGAGGLACGAGTVEDGGYCWPLPVDASEEGGESGVAGTGGNARGCRKRRDGGHLG